MCVNASAENWIFPETERECLDNDKLIKKDSRMEKSFIPKSKISFASLILTKA